MKIMNKCFFARRFAKKLPERAKAFVRVQLEQIMFQAEFAPAQQWAITRENINHTLDIILLVVFTPQTYNHYYVTFRVLIV